MSGIMLNLVFDPVQGRKSGKAKAKVKHSRYLKQRRYLEKMGVLKEEENEKGNKWKKKKPENEQLNGNDQTKPVPVNSSEPSSSASVPQATIQRKVIQEAAPYTLEPSKYLALDCEMVGTGPKGFCSELARCSIVSYNGDVVYDKFIKPVSPVTDFRTRWSGIRKKDLFNATPFKEAQKEILKIIKGKMVVGHALHNDFKVLKYQHPACQTRDTSLIPLLNEKAGLPLYETVSLKRFTKAIFDKDIQKGHMGHSSVEDAKATMELYKVVEDKWEQSLSAIAANMK